MFIHFISRVKLSQLITSSSTLPGDYSPPSSFLIVISVDKCILTVMTFMWITGSALAGLRANASQIRELSMFVGIVCTGKYSTTIDGSQLNVVLMAWDAWT